MSPGLEGALSLNSAGAGALELRRHRGPWETPGRFEPVPPDAAAGAPNEAGPAPPAGSDGVVFVAAIVAGLTELLARIEDGGPHASGGREGRQALEMFMGVYESHRRGGARVELPLAAREHPLVRWRREARPAG